jgi:hypothetical protein
MIESTKHWARAARSPIIGRGVACSFREVNLHYAEYCVQLEMSVVRSSEVSVFRGEFT